MDSWYLALLGLAEHFRTIKPPDYRRCIQCLMAVFHAKPPPKVEARTHLQLGTILYTHTKNIDLAKTHLEQAWLLSQNLTSFDDVKFEAASLLAEVTEHLHQDALDAASSAAALPGAPGSNDAKAILRKALELSQATHVYWHCRLLFQLAQMHAKEKDYASALGLLGVGIDYSQGSSAQFTRILFTLSKAMLLLTSGGMVEAADVLNQGGTFLEAFTGSSHQKEYLKVFFLVLQVCHYLMVGQVKSVKPGLKQLQQSVQTITQPNWPNDEDLASATCIADNFMWLPKEHMCVLVYLVTISHSMQAGYMEKAQKYSEKALAQVEKMKAGDKRPLLLNFQRMILEHMVLCQLVMGHRGLALRELNNLCHLLYFPDTNSSADKALKKYLTQLRRSTRPQMHALLGLCAMSLDELDIAERQFATAVQGSNVALATKPELIVFVHLNMAIIRLMKSQMQGNPQQIVSNEDAEIVERLADPERIPQHSHGLRAAGLYVRGLHAFLGGRFNEAKSFLRDTLKMANAEDLNRLTSISLVLLGHIFLALNNSRESSNMVTPAMQLASKIPDATIQLWAASIQRRLYRVCGDTNREQECLNLAQGFSQGLSRDQEEAKVLPEHALLLWLGDTDAAVKPPPFVPAGNAQEPPGHPRVAPGPASNPHLSSEGSAPSTPMSAVTHGGQTPPKSVHVAQQQQLTQPPSVSPSIGGVQQQQVASQQYAPQHQQLMNYQQQQQQQHVAHQQPQQMQHHATMQQQNPQQQMYQQHLLQQQQQQQHQARLQTQQQQRIAQQLPAVSPQNSSPQHQQHLHMYNQQTQMQQPPQQQHMLPASIGSPQHQQMIASAVGHSMSPSQQQSQMVPSHANSAVHVAMAASSPSSSASASPSSSSSSGVRHQMMHNPHLLAHHQTHISHQTQSVAQVQQAVLSHHIQVQPQQHQQHHLLYQQQHQQQHAYQMAAVMAQQQHQMGLQQQQQMLLQHMTPAHAAASLHLQSLQHAHQQHGP